VSNHQFAISNIPKYRSFSHSTHFQS
jgi:hypothetical protein